MFQIKTLQVATTRFTHLLLLIEIKLAESNYLPHLNFWKLHFAMSIDLKQWQWEALKSPYDERYTMADLPAGL